MKKSLCAEMCVVEHMKAVKDGAATAGGLQRVVKPTLHNQGKSVAQELCLRIVSLCDRQALQRLRGNHSFFYSLSTQPQ